MAKPRFEDVPLQPAGYPNVVALENLKKFENSDQWQIQAADVPGVLGSEKEMIERRDGALQIARISLFFGPRSPCCDVNVFNCSCSR
jgi:hypothetical protein